jgi:RNA polymerase sigma factor (sigma-70 family)
VRPVLHHLARLLAREAASHLSDVELLELYRSRRDERAFAALLARYGPMVLGVCRRALGHEQDAEDVFQATFLVLARRAADIRRGASVGNWLHGVAARLARQAQRTATRRQRHERALAARAVPTGEPSCPELLQVLDEELQRLPELLRAPLLLCYLAGQSQQQAARQLRWNLATVRRRLAQGRERLRNRLRSRGWAPAALLTATATTALATVPPPLASATVRAAGGGAVSSSVTTLMEKGLRTMLLTRTKFGIALVLGLSLSAGFVAHQTLTAQQPNVPPTSYQPGDPNGAAPDFKRGFGGRPNQAPPPNLDQSLADLEKRLEGALDEVRALRQAVKATQAGMTTFPLKHANAADVAEVLRAAYADAHLRITTDDRTNSIILQAGPADTQAVRRLLEVLDSKKAPTDSRPPSNPIRP